MSDFKINGRSVEQSDWDQFRKLAESSSDLSAGRAFDDNVLTADELQSMFDFNRNGSIECNDFMGVRPQVFGKLKTILAKYGYDLPDGCSNSSYDYRWSNKEYVIAAVKLNGGDLYDVSSRLRKDPEVVLAALRAYHGAVQLGPIRYADASLKKNREFMLEAIKSDASTFRYADESLQKDRVFVLDSVRQNSSMLSLVDASFKRDREIVLTAVRQSGSALQFADESFRNDRDIVLAAAQQDSAAFQYAGESLRKDRSFVLEAVKRDASALQFADVSLKRDREIVLAAVSSRGWAFQYADDSLKKDRVFVLEAVKRDASALQFADAALKRDREIVLAAVSSRGWAFQYVDDSLKKDRVFALEVVKKDALALEYADSSLRGDEEIVMTAVKGNGLAFQFADESLRRDRYFVLQAVIRSGTALQFADPSLLKDTAFLSQLVVRDINGLQALPPTVRNAAWKSIVTTNRARLLQHFNPADLSDFQHFATALKERYGIEFIERFRSIEGLLEVLGQRKDPDGPEKKLAILVYPKADYNGAFSRYPVIDRLMELGFAVRYYEAGTEQEVRSALNNATNNGKFQADMVVLVGHGRVQTLALSDDPRPAGIPMNDEQRYIDTGDFTKNGDVDMPLDTYMKNGGSLVLYSCSNGEGGESAKDNLANTVARAFPDIRILATETATNIFDIRRDSDGRLFVEWEDGETYIGNGPRMPKTTGRADASPHPDIAAFCAREAVNCPQ